MTGIDTAMPDVRKTWSYHARWNQSDRLWEQDFRQLASCGFDLLRWGMPWSLVEPQKGNYRWELIDPQVELATRLGMEIFYPIVHFNLPTWLAENGEKHAVFSEQLSDRLADFTGKILERYHFRLVIPVVEVQMDAFQRGRTGNWQPHLKNRKSYDDIRQRLTHAFKASSKVAREYGAMVCCSEPAPALDTVLELRDSIDLAGIDLYPHLHRRRSVLGYFRQWWKATGVPLVISEFGTPETWDAIAREDHVDDFVTAGVDNRRVYQARLLRAALIEASREGIPIPYGGWYPGTGNIGWGSSLTRERIGLDCDRAGLVDLARQPDGSLTRVLCHDLVEEILGLRELSTVGTKAIHPARRTGRWTAPPAVEPVANAVLDSSDPQTYCSPSL